MVNSLLTGDIQREENDREKFQKPVVDQEEKDQPVMQEEGSQNLIKCCIAATKSSILRRAEQNERQKLKKRVSFDKESIERKRGKVSRRPRRRRAVPVVTPLRDFIAIMTTFLLAALFSSFLRDQQRQAQQNYLNRKAQAKQKRGLSERRKHWQQQRMNIQPKSDEPESIDESVIVSSELSSPVNTQIKVDGDVNDIAQALRSGSAFDNAVATGEKLSEDRSDASNEMEGRRYNTLNEDANLNGEISMNDSQSESSEASSVTQASASPDSESEAMVQTHGAQGEHVEL